MNSFFDIAPNTRFLACLGFVLASLSIFAAAEPVKPNMIVVMADEK